MFYYLGTTTAAKRLGMAESTFRAKRGSVRTTPIPEPDVMIDDVPGWKASTIEAWRTCEILTDPVKSDVGKG